MERQALYFQRFTVATLFVQKLIETVPDGADELAEQLNQLAAFMADSMCLLHMVLQPLGFFALHELVMCTHACKHTYFTLCAIGQWICSSNPMS